MDNIFMDHEKKKNYLDRDVLLVGIHQKYADSDLFIYLIVYQPRTVLRTELFEYFRNSICSITCGTACSAACRNTKVIGAAHSKIARAK
jgi:hypothetical protein